MKQFKELREFKTAIAFFDLKTATKAEKLAMKMKIFKDSEKKGKQYTVHVDGKFSEISKWLAKLDAPNPILDEKTVTVIADYDGYGSSNTGFFMKKYKIKIKTMRGGEAKISGKAKDIRKFLDSDDYDQGDADDVADANPQLRK